MPTTGLEMGREYKKVDADEDRSLVLSSSMG